MADSEGSRFHHRSNFGNKRKSHKINGKSKPSSSLKSFGRVDPTKNVSENERKFRHCNQFRDIGKAQRKAIAKEKRKIHREKLIKNKLKYFSKSRGGTPKIIAIIGLSPYSNTRKVKKHLLRHCGIDCDIDNNDSSSINECQAIIGNQKSNFLIYECCNRNDTFSILDICKIADIILLITSPKPKNINTNKDKWNDCILGLDDKSKLFCSLIKSVGGGSGTTIYGLYQPKFYKQLNNLQKNNKSQQTKLDPLIKNTFLNYLHHQFGTSNNSKNIRIFHCYDMPQIFRFMHLTKNYNDSNLVNCEWKQKRPHLLIQNLNKYDSQNQLLQIDGYLRGSIKLNINRPIHITGFGDYLVEQIDGLIKINNVDDDEKVDDNDNHNDNDDDDDDLVMNFVNDHNDKHKDTDYETVTLVKANHECQDKLQALGSLDGLASQFDQTIITESELKEIEQERQKRIEKEKLEQKGLSDYNMEWIDDDDGGDVDDDDDDMNMEIDNDDDEEQRKFEREEFEFPDEVETPINIRAKDKFAQYRGLKQFYKTKWDKFELLPVEYSQIVNITDWKKALKINKLPNIIKQQNDNNNDENDEKLVECGKKIRISISGITQEIYNKLLVNFDLKKPLIIWGLLKYENKISVCHYLIQKHNEYNKPIQGLKRYIFDVGFRRFESNPIFSDNSNGNKHLIKKFINDNQFVVASIYGFITYPPINTIIFDKEENDKICCYGNLLNIDTHRLLIKRKVLTGSAIRVQRRRAVIRYMFWNSDDVNYFKPIDLWTKHGLKGRIEQAIGDKGYMKCFFNGNIKQNDTVCLSLYKRVFPFKDENLFTL